MSCDHMNNNKTTMNNCKITLLHKQDAKLEERRREVEMRHKERMQLMFMSVFHQKTMGGGWTPAPYSFLCHQLPRPFHHVLVQHQRRVTVTLSQTFSLHLECNCDT